jgi:hypothetical protein
LLTRFSNDKLKALVEKNSANHDVINLRGDRSVRKSDYRSEASSKSKQSANNWERNLWGFFKVFIGGLVCVMLWAFWQDVCVPHSLFL